MALAADRFVEHQQGWLTRAPPSRAGMHPSSSLARLSSWPRRGRDGPFSLACQPCTKPRGGERGGRARNAPGQDRRTETSVDSSSRRLAGTPARFVPPRRTAWIDSSLRRKTAWAEVVRDPLRPREGLVDSGEEAVGEEEDEESEATVLAALTVRRKSGTTTEDETPASRGDDDGNVEAALSRARQCLRSLRDPPDSLAPLTGRRLLRVRRGEEGSSIAAVQGPSFLHRTGKSPSLVQQVGKMDTSGFLRQNALSTVAGA
jgi:hypothetical protein